MVEIEDNVDRELFRNVEKLRQLRIEHRDLDEIIALGADCLCYAGDAVGREHDAVEEMAKFLRAGTNVVSFAVGYGPNRTHFNDTTALRARLRWLGAGS